MLKWKPGDKIELPITKSVSVRWNNSIIINIAISRGQNFLYVLEPLDFKPDVIHIGLEKYWTVGEHFLAEDLKFWSRDTPPVAKIIQLHLIHEEIHEQKAL